MASVFTALGVDFDVTESLHQRDPMIIVRNKAARIEEICQGTDAYLEAGYMSASEATAFRGRFVFSNSQTYGSGGALAYYHLGLISKMSGNPWAPLGAKLRWALQC